MRNLIWLLIAWISCASSIHFHASGQNISLPDQIRTTIATNNLLLQKLQSATSTLARNENISTNPPITNVTPTIVPSSQPQTNGKRPHVHHHRVGVSVPPTSPLPYQLNESAQNKAHLVENHEAMAAASVFRNLLQMSFSKMNKTRELPVSHELTFHDRETIATIYTNLSINSVHCNLIEVNTPEESDRVLKRFAQDKRRVLKVNFRTILAIITACQALDPDVLEVKKPKSNNFAPFTPFSTTLADNIDSDSESAERYPTQSQSPLPSEMWTIVSGILPGTKWCGLGDIAKGYNDLGTDRRLDKCCRAHDHCPTKLKALRSGYGLVNWSFYTKSHCDCDSLLYDCLKRSNNPTANTLGNFYFNILKVQCIEEEEPMKCTLYDEHLNQCKTWQPDLDRSTNRKMYFRNFRRQF